MQEPFYSIIMPVFNSGNYLDDAVESIISQSFTNFELFLVDDGSTDNSSEKCDEYANCDNRIKVIHQKNLGMGASRNKAIKLSKGKYIGFCDHDDIFLPGCLETCYCNLIKTGADIIKFGCRELYVKDNFLVKNKKLIPARSVVFDSDEIAKAFSFKFDNDYMAYIWDGFYRRELFKNEIKFNLEMRTGYEDEEIQMKMFPKLKKIQFIQNIFYIHNIRDDFSNSKKHNDNQLKGMFIAAKEGNIAVNKLQVYKICPSIYSVLIGRHLVTALRCVVYASDDRDVREMLLYIRNHEAVLSNLRVKYILSVFRRKKIWGLVYTLFVLKQISILSIIVLLIRKIKVMK